MSKNSMGEDLRVKVENMSTFQRSYCEYRAKGLSQALSAEKAGSTASDAGGKGRVGYQIEQMDGAKDYIEYLRAKRSEALVLDDVDVVKMAKDVYDRAMQIDRLKEAVEVCYLIGQATGLVGKNNAGRPKEPKVDGITTTTKNNTDAFKEEDVDVNESKDRMVKLQQMLKDLNKS